MKAPLNILTIDLEEWFVVETLRERYPSGRWADLESTVISNTERLLNLLDRKRTIATFFVLGWCAEQYPQLIRNIAARGHEIACHSYWHRRVDSLDRDEFRRDTQKAIEVITQAVGIRPLGYRAPSWSINDSIPWAFEVLAELDFEYDSSIFPIKHDLYGMPKGPRTLFRMKFDNGKFLYEMPATTYRFFGRNLPAAGGGYLRHCPYWYSRSIIRRLNRRGQPAVVYIHPWELDPHPPQIEGLTSIQRLRTYGSTSILQRKVDKLLTDFQFTSMTHYIASTRQQKIGFH